MISIEISVITFVLVFGGALLGLLIGGRLCEHHQSADTKDTVRLGMGVVGTITALVLGLLISSAKTYYDNQRDELAQMSANVVMLGRLLRHYGPEANAAHEILRLTVGQFLVTTWPEKGRDKVDVLPPTAKTESLLDQVQNLVPKDDTQRHQVAGIQPLDKCGPDAITQCGHSLHHRLARRIKRTMGL